MDWEELHYGCLGLVMVMFIVGLVMVIGGCLWAGRYEIYAAFMGAWGATPVLAIGLALCIVSLVSLIILAVARV